jgi:glycosyltransferase involved in cell wall biosynthesis
MGPQDGVDHALRALAHLRHDEGRTDFHAAFIGAGPAHERCVALAHELGLDALVEFTGLLPATDDRLASYLATADIGLSPDPFNPMNDLSSMNKVVEYLAMGVPVVAFDLAETRVSAGEAGVYAPINDDRAFASCISQLLDDEPRRRRMSEEGRRRVSEHLSWDVSRRNLLVAYASLLGPVPVDLRGPVPEDPREPAPADRPELAEVRSSAPRDALRSVSTG